MYRLLALDLDGTLLRSDGTLSPVTVASLRDARAASMAIVFATARPPRAVDWIADRIGVGGVAICQNGAVLYDLDDRTIRHRSILPRETALAVIGRLKAVLPECAMAAEAGAVFRYEAAYRTTHPVPDYAERLACEAFADDQLTKLIVQHPEVGFDSLLETVSRELGALAEVSYSGGGFVEITAPGVTKLAALQRLAVESLIDASEVLAFGDMPIDLPMLRWAGTGYAMANAHPALLAAIADVAPSNDDDGVAVVVNELLERNDIVSTPAP